MGVSDDGFQSASPWLAPGATSFLHRNAPTFEQRVYRLKVVSGAGNANVVFRPATLPTPA
jgi:hypothetical protein